MQILADFTISLLTLLVHEPELILNDHADV